MQAIIQADRLAAFLDRLDPIVAEAKLHTDGEDAERHGLWSRAVDPANVCMGDVSLGADAFESFDAPDDGVTLGVSTERLAEVVNFADSGELVHLELDSATRKLAIQAGGLEYTLALIDPDSIRNEPDIPDLELPAEVTVEARHLSRGIKAADMVSDHIRLRASAEERVLAIEAEGDTDDVSLDIGREDMEDAHIDGEGDSLYSLAYLKDLEKPWNAGEEVTVRLGEEFPLKMSGEFADGEGSWQNMVAPRIQSD